LPVFRKLAKYGPVNSHDLIKAFALVTMTLDHVGIFLMPDELWLRAIGRITFPVWFFLIGYARGSRITSELLVYAGLLLVIQAVSTHTIFPMNALVSIIFCRLALSIWHHYRWLERYPVETIALCVSLFLLSMYLFEYGTLAIGFAFAGRMLREGKQGPRLQILWVVLTAFFVVMQLANFDFDLAQMLWVTLGTFAVCWWLYHFRVTPVAMRPLPGQVIMLLSRYSLEYYVLHRAALQLIGVFVLGIVPA